MACGAWGTPCPTSTSTSTSTLHAVCCMAPPGWDFWENRPIHTKKERGVQGRCKRPVRWSRRPAWPMGCVGRVQGRGGRGMSPMVVLCARMWPLNTPPPGLREPPGRAPTDDAPCASMPRPAAWRGPRYVLDRYPRRWPPHWPTGAGSRAPPPRAAIGRRRQSLKGCVDRTSVCASCWCQCHGWVGDTESTHFYWSGASMDAVPLPAEAPHCLLKAGANRLQPVDLPVAEDAGGSPWRAF